MPKAKIHYHDIGDYLKQKEKLDIIRKFGSVLNPQMKWKTLQPNDEGDWLNQRNEAFSEFVPIDPEKKFKLDSNSFFVVNSRGIETARDAWIYNYSKTLLLNKISFFIQNYNSEVNRYLQESNKQQANKTLDLVDTDPTRISWSSSLISQLERGYNTVLEPHKINIGLYRPFSKLNIYRGEKLIHRKGQHEEFFPNPTLKNLVICVSGMGGNKNNTTLITNIIPDLNCLDAGTQCFPLYYYEEQEQQDLFSQASGEKYIRRDGVSDFILQKAQKQYGKTVTKEDIFYYVYGFLHSPNYRESFANDLKKMLPRLPLVDDVRDFYKFSNAGRKLADLHINYEAVEPFEGEGFEVRGAGTSESSVSDDLYRVQKMRFPKKGQKDTIIYNSKITISGIPEKAYEYVVNGKSAIAWIIERYQVKTDKKSGIKNDPNDWAKETGNPRYILGLLLSIINVSVQTVDIVNGLPEVEFE